VSTKNLAGLPRIADFAYQSARAGIVPLLQFLGILSVNLAVLNFLPIPPLDGGQIAFLLAEKIRGKPLPETTLTVMMIGGIVLVVSLMLFTIIQDIWLMVMG
jgi:regulator of sigma E protease